MALRNLLCAAAACAGLLAAPALSLAAKKDNSIRFAVEQAPESIDPYFNNVRIGVIIGQHVWDTLIYRDPKSGEYKGQLAQSWKWLDDRALEVDLKRGIRFHNGEEFNADDVVYTLNFVADPQNKVVTQSNVNWIEKAEKVDSHKVRIRTRRPFPAAIEYLSGPVVIHPSEYYQKVGPQGMNTAPVGTGPFRVVEHSIGKYVRLERNKDYFKESPKQAPRVDRLEMRFIPDRQTQAAEMLAGGLDIIMGTPTDQARQMKAMPNLQVKSGETMRIVFLGMNTLENGPLPALRDIRVREAIGRSIDRDTMVRQLVGEGARVLNVRDKQAAYIRYDAPARTSAQVRQVGLFVFGDDKKDVDVGAREQPDVGNSNGYNVVTWREGDIVYQLVTDLEEADIRDLLPPETPRTAPLGRPVLEEATPAGFQR